ncbi:MAG: polysaccharide export protein, partial [Elusimicrobia bacterium]|nr:polysaccharide export protein [Elusimicrobiota bacterium]
MKLLLPALLLAGAGCAGLRPAASAPASAKAAANQEQAEAAALESVIRTIQDKKTDYSIGGADLLEIQVFQQEELDRKLRVSQNGSITFPLVGTVQVGGLSAAQAEEALKAKLKEYLINPQVTIFIREYGNKKVFVLGEVSKPGSFELPTESKLTVLEAISLAGGFTGIAAPDRTKVIRNMEGKSRSFTIAVS